MNKLEIFLKELQEFSSQSQKRMLTASLCELCLYLAHILVRTMFFRVIL